MKNLSQDQINNLEALIRQENRSIELMNDRIIREKARLKEIIAESKSSIAVSKKVIKKAKSMLSK